jgi:hypothetical protein
MATMDATQFGSVGGRIGKPAYIPTEEDRAFVIESACLKGRVWTARQLGIAMSTLFKHYKEEIDQSKAEACALIGPSLFQKALAGDGASQRFFLVTQGGGDWSPKMKHEHSGPGGQGIPMKHDFSPLVRGKTIGELSILESLVEGLIASGAANPAGGTESAFIGDPEGEE